MKDVLFGLLLTAFGVGAMWLIPPAVDYVALLFR